MNTKIVERIAPMHCTGKEATQLIKETFGERFIQTKQGDIIKI